MGSDGIGMEWFGAAGEDWRGEDRSGMEPQEWFGRRRLERSGVVSSGLTWRPQDRQERIGTDRVGADWTGHAGTLTQGA